jgi:large subunit ribosomal protein L29
MPNPAVELRELPDEELLNRLESAKEELFNLRFQLATGQLDNPSMIKRVRHDIARLATVIRQRETEAELEVDVARADEESLAEGRKEQRTGRRKRTSLKDMEREALEEQESEETEASEEEE